MSGRREIVEALMLRLGLSRRQAEQLVDAIFAELRRRLAAGERVTIRGFGTFSTTERLPRAGRNPFTGEAIRVGPARRTARFKPSQQLELRIESSRREEPPTPPPPEPGGRFIPRPGEWRRRDRDEVADKLRKMDRAPRGFATTGGRGESDTYPKPPPKLGLGPRGPEKSRSAARPKLRAKPRMTEEAPPRPAGGDRQIVVALEEPAAAAVIPVGETATLAFWVGPPVAGNLAEGPGRDIADGAVPPEGLDTEWMILSRDLELIALDDGTRVERADEEAGTVWTARFELHLPARGESARRRLGVRAGREGEARLTVALVARRRDRFFGELREVFRTVTARLVAGRGARDGREAVALESDQQLAAAAHTNPRPTHQWTTPPGRLEIARLDDRDAMVDGRVLQGGTRIELEMKRVPWPVAEAQVRGAIDNARGALDVLRSAHGDYLDAVDPDDLDTRLAGWRPPAGLDWNRLPDASDATHRELWREVEGSTELYDLAIEGFALYRAFFPDGSQLRSWLDAQPRGFRLDVFWRPGAGVWLPDVPWNLMHRRPPRPGRPVDPLDFLGLGFRLGHQAHEVSGVRTLGAPGESRRANLLYWHDDETGDEARRQRERWRALAGQVFVPADPADADRMEQVLRMLDRPAPAPVAVLYAFCQADAAQPRQPRLRFGGNWASDSGVTHRQLGTDPLADEPLVFVNACDSVAGSAVYANALTESFAGRRARGYLGTLTRVPIRFADRFATVFFHLFERRFDPQPLAAGEAVALTRLFFWLEYRNLGGLFYSYLDQYDLFLASEHELQALRAG